MEPQPLNSACKVWTKTDDGYCTEISDLTANGNPVMPEIGIHFSTVIAVAHINEDNEITHWTYHAKHRGKKYTVFND